MPVTGYQPFSGTQSNPRRGLFIVFEGLDASGLSTQARRLYDWFARKKQIVHLTKEPSEGPAGSHIRLALRHRLVRPTASGASASLDELTFALLFAADRADHLYTDVVPQLESGAHVICDRYYLSSLAYQSLSVDLDWLTMLNSPFLRPDLIIYVDVPVDICIRRILSDRARPEKYEKTDQLALVQGHFNSVIEFLRREGQRIEILDGNRPLRDVHADVVKLVSKLVALPRNADPRAGQLGLSAGDRNQQGGQQ